MDMLQYEHMNQPIDFLAIGDIVVDAFIQLKDAQVRPSDEGPELCLRFGDKVPFESATVVYGVGNSANAAVSASRLGLRSALIADVGDDQNGRACAMALVKDGVVVDYLRGHEGMPTNYHYALCFGPERTILVKHEKYPYQMPVIDSEVKWLYLSSVGESSLPYHQEIIAFLDAHPETKLVFQPGTFQMIFGIEALKGIYERTDIFFCNVEEAKRILGIDAEITVLMQKLHELGPKIVVVTDGPKGAYAYSEGQAWFMPIYPDPQPPTQRTGAGDAFASTFSSAIILGKSVEEALLWAPINPMSVIQHTGAQFGLVTREALENYLATAPEDFKPKRI